MSRTIFRKFDVQARRKGRNEAFTPWTLVSDQERAAKHAERAAELGYESRVVEVFLEATEGDVLKAVKCCRAKTCEDCPYDQDDSCYSHLQRDIIDVILSQRKRLSHFENEASELNKANKELIKQISTLRSIIAEEVIEKIYEKSERIANPYKGRSDKFVLSEASINSILKGFCVKKYEN